MRTACLILLSSLALCSLSGMQCQNIPTEEEPGERPSLDEILQRAQSLLMRSILKKMEEDENGEEPFAPQSEWLEKRQHPGKREEEEEGDDADDEDYPELQKRQHPGKREDETELVGLQRRQHPGKRWMLEQMAESPGAHSVLLGALSKRQHPGKRLAAYSKRQHPGRRYADADGEADEPDSGASWEMDKRQHPGKRFWDASLSDASSGAPCVLLASPGCSRASRLLELLHNASKSRAEEKRQHPGKRLIMEEDLTELE